MSSSVNLRVDKYDNQDGLRIGGTCRKLVSDLENIESEKSELIENSLFNMESVIPIIQHTKNNIPGLPPIIQNKHGTKKIKLQSAPKILIGKQSWPDEDCDSSDLDDDH